MPVPDGEVQKAQRHDRLTKSKKQSKNHETRKSFRCGYECRANAEQYYGSAKDKLRRDNTHEQGSGKLEEKKAND